MLRLDLSRLDREGTVRIEEQVPPDADLWQDMEVTFEGPVQVRLTAMEAGSGEIVVRGTVEADYRQECRRCLEPVRSELDAEVTAVFVAAEDPEAHVGDDDVRLFDAKAAELDLSYAVREEMVLAIDRFVVCDPECAGLCPKCGTNLNEAECDCTFDEPDSRWDALRSLQDTE